MFRCAQPPAGSFLFVASCQRAAAGGDAQVVQAPGHFHDRVHQASAQVAKGVKDDAAALDAAEDMLDTDAVVAQKLVARLLAGKEFAAPRLLLGLERGLGSRRSVALKAGVLHDHAAGRKDEPALVGELFVVHAAGAGRSQVDHALVAGRHQQVLLAVALLFAAVVGLLNLFIPGPADGPLGPVDEQKQLRRLGQEGGHVRGPAGGQEQLPSQHRAQQRGEPLYPLANLRLTQGEDKAHDFLGGIALEVEKEEQELVAAGGQLALLSARPISPLPGTARVGVLLPLARQELLQTRLQAHELRQVQGGERAQKPGLVEDNVHVHAPTISKNPGLWLHPIESNLLTNCSTRLVSIFVMPGGIELTIFISPWG